LIRIRLWRPFPFEDFRKTVNNAKTLIVLDRALSLGGPSGPVCSEVKSALYPMAKRPKVISFVGGLGGRDISSSTFVSIIEKGMKKSGQDNIDEFEMIEVRE
jgi:pyruvate ferredoxin oxidoreductase alpha subunit